MPTDELIDPVPYAGWVPVLGVVLIVLAVAWVCWVLLSRWLVRGVRAPEPPAPGPVLALVPGPDPFAAIRPVYLARVDEVQRRFGAGELDGRGLHLALSAVVRDFGAVRTGIDASRMTLREIRAVGATAHLARLVESYYRPAFARDAARTADVGAALSGARWVIGTW